MEELIGEMDESHPGHVFRISTSCQALVEEHCAVLERKAANDFGLFRCKIYFLWRFSRGDGEGGVWGEKVGF